jgi:Na+/H+ antiporter NhaC
MNWKATRRAGTEKSCATISINSEVEAEYTKTEKQVSFYAGTLGALAPFIVFVAGVASMALTGAPDERGFWPVLILSLTVALLLARNKRAFCETVIEGMSQHIVMIMIMAWILASMIGVLMSTTGFVEALVWVANKIQLGSTGFVAAAFIICCTVSLSTGSSFATILICSPLLYPAGGLLGAHLPTLAGAIIGGATVGDFAAPISDTTIASALSQNVQIGETVRSRIPYILPAVLFALTAYIVSEALSERTVTAIGTTLNGNPQGLPMLLVPALIIFLFLKGKHVLHGLLMGLAFGVTLGLLLGLLSPDKLFSLDLANFTAKSIIIDGINRAVGISFFTILLMGLVAALRASGLVTRLVEFAGKRSRTTQHAEVWIAGTSGAAVLLITHSVVAILTVAEFVNRTGEKFGIHGVRRANLLSLVGCVFPFILPYFIPVILMANTTLAGQDHGIAAVTPLEAGLYNFVSWALLAVLVFSLLGYGRNKQADNETLNK